MNEDLDLTKFPYGICPFMSGQLAPISGSGGIIPPGQQISISSINLPCMGDKCQMWDGNMCSLCKTPSLMRGIVEKIENLTIRLSDIGDSLARFDPPSNGPGPLMRIADALEARSPKNK